MFWKGKATGIMLYRYSQSTNGIFTKNNLLIKCDPWFQLGVQTNSASKPNWFLPVTKEIMDKHNLLQVEKK